MSPSRRAADGATTSERTGEGGKGMSGEAGSDKAGSGEAQGGVTGVTTSLETREDGGG
jgi:hypothetical protein